MKISEQWLREWVNPALSTQALADQMTMTGLSIESTHPVAGVFSNVVVGEIVTRVPHPNADKLSCCEVNVGETPLLKIVCGAPNARAGIKVAVAKIGAMLPGNFEIKEAKLRGELSQGMLCSLKELQLQMGQSVQEGIIELPVDAPIGKDFRAYFHADDHIIDIEITPNRGDCLGIRGVARDVACVNQLPFQPAPTHPIAALIADVLPIQVAAKTDCPRYVGRIIRGVNNQAQTPSFMQQRLQRAGIRLISPVVDVCNYVMLELGQPMHAFDLSKLNKAIHVRRATENETVKLLDEQTIQLTVDDLVIADDTQVHALAGIMGGMDSGVQPTTTDIFLEAAFFLPKTICLSKRRHNTHSDSSYRFERGVDFNLPVEAIERATELLLSIVGGQPGKTTEVVSSEHLPVREKIILEHAQIKRILGIDIAENKVEMIFKSLGMSVVRAQSRWEVVPPAYRFDITIPMDLIEELARMTGYNHIPAMPMISTLDMHPKTEARVCDKSVRGFMVNRGYHESMTYSFISPQLHALIQGDAPCVTLQNPLSQDMSVMRTSIWPGLLQALQMNVRHQCERVRLFEMGLCFEPQQDGELLQSSRLAMAATGWVFPEQWSMKKTPVDFFDMKADVMGLLGLSNLVSQYHWKAEVHPALHPGRSAALYRGEERLGWLGELHPAISDKLDFRQPVVVCELDLKKIQESSLSRFEDFSSFPTVRRDLAIVLDQSIDADTIRSVITKKAGNQLVDLHIFDVYQGRGIELSKKSIALGLTFQDRSRTLRDEEINSIIQDVVTVLERELNATLRV
jgi:phenylalanyl-tRNA synthetase beta chain